MIIRLLAKGGTSEVYEAMHIGLKKNVALKVLRPDLAAHADARTDFLREGENAARIRHPHIVDVTDLGAVDQLPYIVMELLAGQDLACTYADRGRMEIDEVVDILLPVVSAVAAGHAQGVIHGDLKPANIFLHREGSRVVPKLLDFGLSRRLHERRAVGGSQIFGTPHYMAPEQARGTSAVDARTDQYAMGVMLYEGVAGRLPRDDEDPQVLLGKVAREDFPRPSEFVDLPVEFEDLILRMMASDRADRYASMLEVARALCGYASDPVHDYWMSELAMLGASEGGIRVAAPVSQRIDAARTSAVPYSRRSMSPVRDSYGAYPRRNSSSRLDAPLHPVDIVMSEGQPDRSDGMVDAQPPKKSSRRALWIAAGGAAVLGLVVMRSGVLDPWLGPPAASTSVDHGAGNANAEPSALEIDVNVEPAEATLILDGKRVGKGHFSGQVLEDGSLHELRVLAEGYMPQTVTFRHDPPPAMITLLKQVIAPAVGAAPAGEGKAGGEEGATSSEASAEATAAPAKSETRASQPARRPAAQPRSRAVARAQQEARERARQRALAIEQQNTERAAADAVAEGADSAQASTKVVEPEVTVIQERDPTVEVVPGVQVVD